MELGQKVKKKIWGELKMCIRSLWVSLSVTFILLFFGCQSKDSRLEEKLGKLQQQLETSEIEEERIELIREITSLDHPRRSNILLTKLSDINYRYVHSEIIISLGKIRPVSSRTIPLLGEKLSQTELRNEVAQAFKEIGTPAYKFLISKLKETGTYDDAYYALSQIATDAKSELIKVLNDESYEFRASILSLLQIVVESAVLPKEEIRLLVNVFDIPASDYNKSSAEFTTISNVLYLCGDASKLILVDSVGSDKLQIRVGAAISLYKIDENQTDFVLPILAEGLKDSFLCDLVVPILAGIGESAVPILEQAFNDESSYLKAAEVLGQLGAVSLPTLSASLKGGDVFQKQIAIETMGKLGVLAKPVLYDLVPLLKDIDLGESVAVTLGSMGPDAVPFLLKSLNSRNLDEKRYALKGLEVVNPLPQSAVAELVKKVTDPEIGILAVKALTAGKNWELDGSRLVTVVPYPPEKLEMIDDWWVIEPFDNSNNIGFNSVYPPEKEIDLNKEYIGKNGRVVRWYKSNGNGNDAFSSVEDDIVGYGLAYISSSRKKVEVLSLGSDDGVKIWLNDQLIWSNDIGRAYILGQDVVSLPLKKGKNKLLFKITQRQNAWGFGAGLGGKKLYLNANSILDSLRKSIQHEDPMIRDQARQVFIHIGSATVPILADLVAKKEQKSDLRTEITGLLGRMSYRTVQMGMMETAVITPAASITAPLLLDLISDDKEEWEIRQIAYDGLFGLSTANHLEAMKAVKEFEQIRRAHNLVESFRKRMTEMEVSKITEEILQVGEIAVPFLIRGFTSEVSVMRGRSANVLVQMGEPVVPALKIAKKSGGQRTKYWVDYTLERIE